MSFLAQSPFLHFPLLSLSTPCKKQNSVETLLNLLNHSPSPSCHLCKQPFFATIKNSCFPISICSIRNCETNVCLSHTCGAPPSHLLHFFYCFTTFYIVVHTWWLPCNQPYCGPLSERTLPHCTFYTSVSPNTAIPGSRLRSGPIWIRVKLWLSQIRLKIRIIFNGECHASSFVSQMFTIVGSLLRAGQPRWCLYTYP